MSTIFISYRRESSLAVDHVHEKLKAKFSAGTVFLDKADITPGEPFPDRIRRELADARVVLVMIGRNWISQQEDRTYRRRLEIPEDWVHQEVAIALGSDAVVIPVVIEDCQLPTREQLPGPLQGLADRNAVVLAIDRFREDVEKLVAEIKLKLGRERAERLLGDSATRFPPGGSIVPSPLTPETLSKLSTELPQWRVEESLLDGDPRFGPDYKRQELARDFRFDSFLRAVEFMKYAAESIDDFGHHPRWENVFKTVTIHYSTWDIGHRPSDRDVKCAYMLEKLYKEFLEES